MRLDNVAFQVLIVEFVLDGFISAVHFGPERGGSGAGLRGDYLITIALREDRLRGNCDGQSGNYDDHTGRQEFEHSIHAIPPCNASQCSCGVSVRVRLRTALNYKEATWLLQLSVL